MRRWKWVLVACAVAAPVIYATTYFAALNSDAFSTSAEYIRGAPEIVSSIGRVKNVRLDPFTYEVRMNSDEGHAMFLAEVTGEKGTGLAKIFLNRELRVWHVTELRFNKKS
jgi:hypothetical protein